MKKLCIAIAVFITAVEVYAQNINDVVRFGVQDLQGTARFQGLSGAFGALGGDLSAINVNPAGSAVFDSHYLTFTGTNYHSDNETIYGGGNRFSSDIDNFEFNQGGGVFVYNNTNENSGWRKFTIAFNYELADNFDNEFFASGTSTTSIDQYFLSFAQGQPLGPLLIQQGENIEDAFLDIGASLGFGAQQAFLGLFGGIIDPVDANDDNNTQFVPTGTFINSVNQRFTELTSGQNNKFTTNFAAQYRDVISLGINLNFFDIRFEKLTLFDEDGFAPDSDLQFVQFDNLQRTFGDGFSFDLGAIFKLNNYIRLGATYQSPTWYRFQDELSQRIDSNLADSEIDFINFSQVSIFPVYRVRIPSKYTASAAIVFPKFGLISFDYSFQDFSNAELQPDSDPFFANENNIIRNELNTVSTFRVGAEYRIIRQLSLRGGYRFEQSPFENGFTAGDLDGYSVGVGYNFGVTKVDLTFNQTRQEFNQAIFDTGLTNPINIDNTNSNISLSVSFNL